MKTGSVLIVCHNSAAYIENCLASVAEKDWEVIVADNASTDDTAQKVGQRTGPPVKMIINSKNRGFAAALNQAAAAATGSLFLVLNPDTMANQGALRALAWLAANSEAAAVAGMLSHGGVPDVGFAIRRFPTLGTVLAEVLLVNRLWKRNPWNRRYRCLDFDYSKLQAVEQPAGACLAVKRSAWETLGGFDERFFPVWFEDVDFCRRLRDRGWDILYCPDAVFQHVGGHSVSRLPFEERQAYWYRNLLLYFEKHHSKLEVIVLRIGISIGLGLRALLSSIGLHPPAISVRKAVAAYCRVLWRCVLTRPDFDHGTQAGAARSPRT